MTSPLLSVFYTVQAWLFEAWVLPIVRWLGLTAFSNEAFQGTETFLIGVLEMALLYCLIRPVEKWRPAEAMQNTQDRRTDFIYTLVHRLGGFALLSFAVLTPVLDGIEAQLRLLGVARVQFDEMALFNGVPLLLFAAYFIALDFVGYWIHRAQHRVQMWWQLHALHHANTSMSVWSDNRNHVLDDLMVDLLIGVVAWFIGVEPAQYVLLVMVTRMLQSLQHANVKLSFGRLGEHLLVSPRFHRVHHALGSGYEGSAYGCNFGVILPWWDLLMGTAKMNAPIEATGVRDAMLGRNYGIGFWSQQRLGFLRLMGKA